MSRNFQGYLFALAAASCFGTLAVSGKYAYADGVSVSMLMALRFGFASLGFVAVMFIVYRSRLISELKKVSRQSWIRLFFIGGVVLAAEVTLFFMGLASDGITAGLAETIFFIYPAWVVLISIIFMKHRVTLTVALCVFLAVVGVALTAGSLGAGSLAGVGYLMSASVLYSFYVAFSGSWIRDIPPLISTAMMITATGISLTIVALIRNEPGPQTSAGWLSVASAVFFGTFLAYAFLYAALHRASASMVAVLTTAEPVVTIVIGAILLGERMDTRQALGALLIVGAVLWLLLSEYRSERPSVTV